MLLFWSFYRLVLQKEKMFVFNRFYLLGGILFSLIIPNITLQTRTTDEALLPNIPFVYGPEAIAQESGSWDYSLLCWAGYLAITFYFFLKYCRGLWQMADMLDRSEQIKKEGYTLALVSEKIVPQTFFKYIFINKEDYYTQHIREVIIYHEKAHAHQLHSLDIVFIELAKVVFWFNPMLKLFSENMRANHEYLADDYALNKVNDPLSYQQLLLGLLTKQPFNNRFSSALTFSLTKNRLIMMTKKISLKKASFKSGGAFVMLVVSFFLFSKVGFAQDGASPEEVKQYFELILDNYDQEGNPVNLTKEEEERILVIYNKMDAGQQAVIRGLKVPYPKSAVKKRVAYSTPPSPPPPPPPPPPLPREAKFYIDGKEVSFFEANMMMPNYKLYHIKRKKGEKGKKDEFHFIRKKEK